MIFARPKLLDKKMGVIHELDNRVNTSVLHNCGDTGGRGGTRMKASCNKQFMLRKTYFDPY